MKFTNTITINRRPAEVFAFLAHFENLPLWNYAISETRKITGGPVGVGSRYRQTWTVPAPSEEMFAVTEFEPRPQAFDPRHPRALPGRCHLPARAGRKRHCPHQHHEPPALGSAAPGCAVGGFPGQVGGGGEPRHAQADPRNGRPT